MLATLAIHSGDAAQALDLLLWMAELGGVHRHEILLVATPSFDPLPHLQAAQRAFSRAELRVTAERLAPWPQGPNLAFLATLKELGGRGPFFFFEPDMVPLRPSWLDEIEAEYEERKATFLGRVNENRRRRPDGTVFEDGEHLNGAMVYPADPERFLPSLRFAQSLGQAWDWLCAYETAFRVSPVGGFLPGPDEHGRLRHGFGTDKIGMAFKTRNYRWENGRVACDRIAADSQMGELDFERHAIWHGAKDGSLLKLVRERHLSKARSIPVPYRQAGDEQLQSPPNGTAFSAVPLGERMQFANGQYEMVPSPPADQKPNPDWVDAPTQPDLNAPNSIPVDESIARDYAETFSAATHPDADAAENVEGPPPFSPPPPAVCLAPPPPPSPDRLAAALKSKPKPRAPAAPAKPHRFQAAFDRLEPARKHAVRAASATGDKMPALVQKFRLNPGMVKLILAEARPQPGEGAAA